MIIYTGKEITNKCIDISNIYYTDIQEKALEILKKNKTVYTQSYSLIKCFWILANQQNIKIKLIRLQKDAEGNKIEVKYSDEELKYALKKNIEVR